MKHTHRLSGQTYSHDHGVSEVHPDLNWREHGYFGHNTDRVQEGGLGTVEATPHPDITSTLDGFLETYAPSKRLISLTPLDNKDDRQVVNIDLTPYAAEDGLKGPFIVVRYGRFTVVLTTAALIDHLSIDAHAFVDGQEATVGAFGMSDGARVVFPDTGTTSHEWPSANMVTLLVGEQARKEQ